MSCKNLTNLEGMKFPSRYKATPNLDEELFINAWDVVSEEVHRLREEGWALDKKGRREQAGNRYQAANIYFYLINYAMIIRNYLERTSLLDQCTDITAYKKACVEKNLPCLSKTYGTDYVNAWVSIMEVFSIDPKEDCDECCVGISKMIIKGDDDCTAFIIGPCEENELEVVGEYEDCNYDDAHTTADDDANCDKEEPFKCN